MHVASIDVELVVLLIESLGALTLVSYALLYYMPKLPGGTFFYLVTPEYYNLKCIRFS